MFFTIVIKKDSLVVKARNKEPTKPPERWPLTWMFDDIVTTASDSVLMDDRGGRLTRREANDASLRMTHIEENGWLAGCVSMNGHVRERGGRWQS